MGRLTTHVLDTARGRPAAGITVELFACGARRRRLAAITTDADGRTAAPLLEGAAFAAGAYELAFHVGAYYKSAGVVLADPPFLDVVVVRFTVARPEQHHHVPLLVSPYGYTTYRGS